MIKTTGAEFHSFYNDPEIWGDKVWHEDEQFFINGSDDVFEGDYSDLNDTDQIKITDGVIYFQDYDNHVPFETYFKKWRRMNKFSFMIVEIPKETEQELRDFVKSLGGRIK